LPGFLLSFPLHHSEAADPDLMAWLIDKLTHVFGGDLTTISIVLLIVIILIPITIVISRRLFDTAD
jgi:hypothetical protein